MSKKITKGWAVVCEKNNQIQFRGDDEENQANIYKRKKDALYWHNPEYEKVIPCEIHLKANMTKKPKEKYPYTVCDNCKKRWNKALSAKEQIKHGQICPKSQAE